MKIRSDSFDTAGSRPNSRWRAPGGFAAQSDSVGTAPASTRCSRVMTMRRAHRITRWSRTRHPRSRSRTRAGILHWAVPTFLPDVVRSIEVGSCSDGIKGEKRSADAYRHRRRTERLYRLVRRERGDGGDYFATTARYRRRTTCCHFFRLYQPVRPRRCRRSDHAGAFTAGDVYRR